VLPDHYRARYQDTEQGLVPENIRAVGTIYVAWQLDALRIFDVGDRLVELSTRGQLPTGRGPAAATMTDYAFDPNRLSAVERQHLYERAFGAPGGIEDEVNQGFSDLWLHFVTGVAEFARRRNAPGLPRPALLAQPAVRRAALALAVNLSRHGSDSANVAAKHLHRTLEQLLSLLKEPEVSKTLGVSNMWEVIDRVNRQYLGGPVEIVRARTLAQAGMHIMAWLATHAPDLHDAQSSNAAGANPPPSDTDLLTTVEHWLAASNLSGSAIEQSAQSSESPPKRAPLIQLPTLGADVLQAVNRIEADARSRAGGVCALFHGPADSGKTLAAQMLASRLARDLYRVDLSSVVATYIGETERNLERVLAQVRETGAVLLFDQADALFGQRSDLTDAHDRYANGETNRLMQHIEGYRGLVILETNRKPALDAAFVCRLRHVIDFPPRAKRSED